MHPVAEEKSAPSSTTPSLTIHTLLAAAQVGNYAVTWMVKSGLAKTRDEAIKFGRYLLISNLASRVTGTSPDFVDRTDAFYRYEQRG